MYTQCPDCNTAFRVTADVLKQAAGKVRCGGCGNAFNALEYLSEAMPERRAPKSADEALPELKPEPLDEGLPKSISAEQSAALLKTLDELAGSDIRIEDTGVEWRVLDDDEVGEAADDDVAVDTPIQDQPVIDELLEESPTPVDQFLTDTPPQVDSPEIFEAPDPDPAQPPVDELRFDDNTPLPEDFGLDDDDAYAPPPVAKETRDEDPRGEIAEEEAQADLDLSDPGEWTDILDEFEDLAGAGDEPTSADELKATSADDADDSEDTDGVEPVADEVDEPEPAVTSSSEPLDVDTQFALQAEAMGIDLSGVNEAPEIGTEPALDEDVDLDAMIEETQHGELDLDDLLDEELVDDGTVGDLDFDGYEDDTDDDEASDFSADEETESDDADNDDEESTQLELITEIDGDVDIEDDGDDAAAALAGHYVPPMSEEEQTINMQIDQDLLAIAVEDPDGFASTIVIGADAADAGTRKDDAADREPDEADADAEKAVRDTSAGFETIIMEGEHIHSAFEQDKREADREAAAASLAGAAAAREVDKTSPSGTSRWGMIAGIVTLALVLVLQGLHQSRESLATIPAFNDVVGPMYRALGKPLSPEWDITGWRFEVTRGSTDEENRNLTIYSRLGNKSDQALPYPLIGISLTDRFEETIGSRILDPADYLSSDLDPRKLVEPGNTFNAVITIPSPAEDATGFKLNVCYRESGGNLRCAIDDFK